MTTASTTTSEQAIEREGIFRGYPIEQGIKKFEKSDAVAVSIKFQITEELVDRSWVLCDDQHVAVGDLWVIKKDGAANLTAVETLRDLFGWDGNLETLALQDWSDRGVQVRVTAEQYEGKTLHKVTWINPFDYAPSVQVNNVDGAAAKELQAFFGAQLRALCSPKPTNAAPPSAVPTSSTSPPPPPPTPGAAATRDSAWQACLTANHDDEEEAAQAWHKALTTIDKQEHEFESSDWQELENTFVAR